MPEMVWFTSQHILNSMTIEKSACRYLLMCTTKLGLLEYGRKKYRKIASFVDFKHVVENKSNLFQDNKVYSILFMVNK